MQIIHREEEEDERRNKFAHCRRNWCERLSLALKRAAVSPPMSDAIAPAPTEDHLKPNSVSKENPHPEQATTSAAAQTYGMHDDAGSWRAERAADSIADSPTKSVDDPLPSTADVTALPAITANTPTNGGPRIDVVNEAVDGPGVTSSFGSTPSPQTAQLENQSPPTIPVRTSSHSHLPSSNVSPLSGPTVIDVPSSQRNSRASGKAGGSRSGSTASSGA